MGESTIELTVTRRNESREAYDVISPSGNTYRVGYCGSGDADPDYVALWECDCPAGKHGKSCKHLSAVLIATDEDAVNFCPNNSYGWLKPPEPNCTQEEYEQAEKTLLNQYESNGELIGSVMVILRQGK